LEVSVVGYASILVEGSIYVPDFDRFFYWEVGNSKSFKELRVDKIVGGS